MFRKKRSSKILGSKGEGLASDFFQSLGYDLVQRNFRTRFGEIDLILRKGQEIVFVEVKTRKDRGFGRPEESVTEVKQQTIRRCAEAWLQKEGLLDGPYQIRFDVLGIILRDGRPPEFTHLPFAF